MMRATVGVIVGYALWSVIWLGGSWIFFSAAGEAIGAGQAYTATGPLVATIGLSVVCSLVAGVSTARLTRPNSRRAAWIVGGLLLATGIMVQAGSWDLLPVWYHLTFLVLLIPVTLAGEKLAGGARA